MPELPEVETVRAGLATYLPGRTVAQVDVRHSRAVRRHPGGPADFATRLRGRSVVDVRRRGKYLWMPIESEHALVAHLGMSGQLLLPDPDRADSPHLRVRIHLAESERDLHFVDQRTFGGLFVDETTSAHGVDVPRSIAHIAPDPFEDAFDDEAFVNTLRARRTGVKRALLDQTVLSGVGNIYADEALWRARLHYDRRTATLSRPAARRLLAAVRDVLGEALSAGGTSFDALYVDVNGESGWFSRRLAVYGRAGQPCRRCQTPVRRDAFMNRSSYTCPRCQPRPRPRTTSPTSGQ